jgi:hypothetical protein
MIKQYKFKIYKHECVECGWSIWRDYVINDAVCSQCGSAIPPHITEEELVREITVYDTYTPEDYARAKKVAVDILAGVPLEEIEGLDLGNYTQFYTKSSPHLLRLEPEIIRVNIESVMKLAEDCNVSQHVETPRNYY